MKYFISGAGVLLIVIAFLVLIFAVVRRPSTDEVVERTELASLADSTSEVTHTVYGRIVADEEFRAIRITVNNQSRTVQILQGYDLIVEKEERLPNNNRAYRAFLHALDTADFTATREFPSEREDGYCASGRRIVYQLRVSNIERQRTWSSSCSRERGTFGGSSTSVARLFRSQIPEYSKFVRGVRL
jgi:hypothetical protein